ncbi:septal ring lytic transglycosylase RlpA family protein [Otariodibacter sp.]|uniref:septal ring lytic transglycosylase RlpA family protein n=1 Tax=Otariodibacter sp. TaxID=3030919 RepID=UPI00260E234E|nr:septal ring lytic transglycosylase RlpA family protein [Otariodibacter sp.]
MFRKIITLLLSTLILFSVHSVQAKTEKTSQIVTKKVSATKKKSTARQVTKTKKNTKAQKKTLAKKISKNVHTKKITKEKKKAKKIVSNETKKLYGIKGEKLTYVKVNNQISSYTIKGKTHTTINKETSRQFSQTGVASYYGTQFHGKKTASGEIYDKNTFTAAHKTLALGSYALVTNLRNGRKIIVRINDRGPFSNGRVIDLSVAAAREIGMLNTGTARVKIEALQVDRQGYISGKGVYTLMNLAKRERLPLKIKGKGSYLAIKADIQ